MAPLRDHHALQSIANGFRSPFSSQDSLSGHPIKNTFIHFPPEDDLQPDMPKSISNFLDGMPAHRHPNCDLSSRIEEDFSKNHQADCIQEGTPQVEDVNQPNEFEDVEKIEGLGTQMNMRNNLEHVDHSIDQNGKADELEQFGQIVQGAPWSVGSAAHDDGNCKPCAWNWKPSGCSKGLSCEFCHSCEKDAAYLKKRASKQLQRILHRTQKKEKNKKKSPGQS